MNASESLLKRRKTMVNVERVVKHSTTLESVEGALNSDYMTFGVKVA